MLNFPRETDDTPLVCHPSILACVLLVTVPMTSLGLSRPPVASTVLHDLKTHKEVTTVVLKNCRIYTLHSLSFSYQGLHKSTFLTSTSPGSLFCPSSLNVPHSHSVGPPSFTSTGRPSSHSSRFKSPLHIRPLIGTLNSLSLI